MLEKDEKISGGQAGFGPNLSCVDHVYTFGNILQGRKDAGLTTYCFFLDVQKAYGTVWRSGLWRKIVASWDQRKYVENVEQYDGMCDKGCNAGRGNI